MYFQQEGAGEAAIMAGRIDGNYVFFALERSNRASIYSARGGVKWDSEKNKKSVRCRNMN